MRYLPQILLMFLAVNVGRAGPVMLLRQLITLPPNATAPLFVDVDGDGRSDMFAIDPVEKKLFYYHQRPAGFTNSPDQVIPLPPKTAWVALCDVDAHPGLELLMSTATGLVYSRQNAGVFESEERTLITASQVFTNNDFPILTSLSANKGGTNILIPVISADQTMLYHRNRAYEWSPEAPLALDVKRTTWSVNGDEWMMGSTPAHSLHIHQTFRTKLAPKRDQEPENDGLRKLIDDLKKNDAAGPPVMDRVDVDGDGREDLILWQQKGKLDFKTDIHVFLRGADQKLPDRPTQVLHCSGFSIPLVNSNYEWSPVHDLRGDGSHELVLLEIRTVFTSPSGLVDMALSRGIDCSLTIRKFHDGAFSRSPDASVPVTILLSLEDLGWWPFFIQGDFNGDGRPDFLVRRSETQWNIFFSTKNARWFAPLPEMVFDAPRQGKIEIQDLNGDGLSDIIWLEPNEHRVSIFMSPLRQTKDKNP